jgi:hypothetical protein
MNFWTHTTTRVRNLVGTWFGTKSTLEDKSLDALSPNQKREVLRLIDRAIDNHNRTATLVSASIGGVLLFFYAHGVVSIVDRTAN